MSYSAWKPTPDFIRSHHISNLERAFERVNQQNRDWHYWLDLDTWSYGRWYDSQVADASTLARVFEKPEVVDLTKQALVILDSARKQFIDCTEFESVIAKIREVLA